MTQEILSILDPFIKKAQSIGADEVEFFAQKLIIKEATLGANNLKSATATIIEGFGVRVLKNKSLGFVSINSLDKTKILEGIKSALAIAKVSPVESNYFLPEKKSLPKISSLYDPTIENLTIDEVISYSNNLLNITKEIDSRVSVESGVFSTKREEDIILTSRGISANEIKSSFQYALEGSANDGLDVGSFDFASNNVVKLKDVNLKLVATDFATKVLNNLKAQKTTPFQGPAVLSPEAAEELFGLLIQSATATTIQAGSSFLQDKLGEKIAIDQLTITDNGTIPNSYFSGSFDREGLPHRDFKIVDKGIFTGVLYDTFTANKENLKSTGHAGGSFRNIPIISTTNLEIKAGTKPFDTIISEIDHGVLIQRISASPDPISGDFSASIKGGRLIKKGEITQTLKEITAVGNIFQGLKNISNISKEQKILRGGTSSLVPYIVIDGINFTS